MKIDGWQNVGLSACFIQPDWLYFDSSSFRAFSNGLFDLEIRHNSQLRPTILIALLWRA
jgi:hypothetical protein